MKICAKVGKRAQVENLLFYWFFCATFDVGRFLFVFNTLQASDPPTLSGFFGLIFPTKRICANSFVAKKSSEMSTLSGSSPVFVSQRLHLKRSSLLNLYLNFKFEITLLSSIDFS